MKIEGELIVKAPINEVWTSINDPERLRRILPGCEDLHQVDDTHFTATLAVKVQFMTIRANATCELVEVVEPSRLVATMVGEATTFAGAFRTTLALDLFDEGPATRIRYEMDVNMLGRLASLGQPIVRSTTKKLANQFAANLAAQIATGSAS